jgi:hypothetical protein
MALPSTVINHMILKNHAAPWDFSQYIPTIISLCLVDDGSLLVIPDAICSGVEPHGAAQENPVH